MANPEKPPTLTDLIEQGIARCRLTFADTTTGPEEMAGAAYDAAARVVAHLASLPEQRRDAQVHFAIMILFVQCATLDEKRRQDLIRMITRRPGDATN